MNAGPRLSLGDTGDDVRRLQRLFVIMRVADLTSINGVFDAATKSRVVDLQRSVDIRADGIVDTETWSKLPPDPPAVSLRLTDSGAAVLKLQQAFRQMADALVGPRFGVLPADGTFGIDTKLAVQAYQGHLGLTPDGIVGDQTWLTPGSKGVTLYERTKA
jgi:peptidoglycan hydrolase-like protein with peptidoglycan-binding domain